MPNRRYGDLFVSALIGLVAFLPRLYVAIAWTREPVWDGHYYDFGARRIAAYHQQNYQLSAEDLCQGLLSEVAVQPGTALGDDQTVLVLCSPEEK